MHQELVITHKVVKILGATCASWMRLFASRRWHARSRDSYLNHYMQLYMSHVCLDIRLDKSEELNLF